MPFELADVFVVGQFVRVAVRSNTVENKKRRIELTMKESAINSRLSVDDVERSVIQGSIKSEEEHGYTVSLGIEGLSGFVKKDELNWSPDGKNLIRLVSF